MHSKEVDERDRARRFLAQSEAIRESLFRLSTQHADERANLESLELLLDVATKSGIEDRLRGAVATSLELARAGTPVSPVDLAKADSALQECVRSLEDFLEVGQDVSADILDSWTGIAAAYRDSFRLPETADELGVDARAHALNVEETRRAIFQHPGLFILLLYRQLNPTGERRGFSYGSVRMYVDELVRRERVITIGGPQGTRRYCFPDPNQFETRAGFYGGIFAVRAVLEREVSEEFDYSHAKGPIADIFVANGILRDPVLLLAMKGNLRAYERMRIKSYGQIHPFGEIESRFGLVPLSNSPPRDLFVAYRVALAEGPRRETTVWADEEHQDLYPTLPQQLE